MKVNFVMQSSCHSRFSGDHVAIIMDGNGRWAQERGEPRVRGHIQGGESVRKVVRAAPGLGIGTLTLYAFSSRNWGRPAEEVDGLMVLLERYLRDELPLCRRSGVRVNVIGRRDRLNTGLVEAIEEAERVTRNCRRLHLRLAVDYSTQYFIVRAAKLLKRAARCSEAEFASSLSRAMHSDPPSPAVDFLIRTAGERRLSDFMLWECAYAELCFTRVRWPEFDGDHLRRAIEDFRARRRTFGLLPAGG